MHPRYKNVLFVGVPQSGEILKESSIPVELANRGDLISTVDTCLSSKVVHQNSEVLSPIAADAVLAIIDPLTATNVDLGDVRIVKQVSEKMCVDIRCGVVGL